MLGLVLYVLIVLSTGSVILKLESTIYEFSLIFRVFVAFWKKLVSSSDTKVSSDRMFSSLSSRVILFANFLFSEKRVWMFFQKALLSVTLLTYDVSKLPFSCLFFLNSPANISTSDRRCSQRYTTLIQCRCPTLKQCRYNVVHCRINVVSRSYNVVSTLFPLWL